MDNTGNLHPDNDRAYNRRTTDYGNGRIEVAAYHPPRLRRMGGVRKPSGREAETSDKAQEARTKSQIYAIRRRIKGYALSNNFCWFVTLTFDPEKIDSSDYETAKNTLLKWCRWMRDSYGQFGYLMIPELHKSGAVHFHGLLGDIPADFAKAVSPKTGELLTRHGRQVYNLADWKYGFSDCERIESPEKAASYITKYVTSALLTDKKMYNKKRYFNSQGLAKPVIAYGMSDNTDLGSFTPNFGVIETGVDGRNTIDIGIYNLEADPETGTLTQTDTSYFITAKAEHKTASPLAGGWGELAGKVGTNQQQGQAGLEKLPEGMPSATRKPETAAKTEHKTAPRPAKGSGELTQQAGAKQQKEKPGFFDLTFGQMLGLWGVRREGGHGQD